MLRPQTASRKTLINMHRQVLDQLVDINQPLSGGLIDLRQVIQSGLFQHVVLDPCVSLEVLEVEHELLGELQAWRGVGDQALDKGDQALEFNEAGKWHANDEVVLAALHDEVVVSELGLDLLRLHGARISDNDHGLWLDVHSDCLVGVIVFFEDGEK